MKSTLPSEDEEGEERAAGFVLFRSSRQDYEYLILRHRGEEYWAFPKGRLEDGEADLEAALREVGEETGIHHLRPVEGFRRISRYRFARGGATVDKTVVYYLGEALDADVILSSEHVDYRWASHADASRILTYTESRDVLDAAHERLTGTSRARHTERTRSS